MKKDIETIKTEIDYIYNYLEANPLFKVEKLDGTLIRKTDDEYLKIEIRRRLVLAASWLDVILRDDSFIGIIENNVPRDIVENVAGICLAYCVDDYIRYIIYDLQKLKIDNYQLELNQCFINLTEAKVLIRHFRNLNKIEHTNNV